MASIFDLVNAGDISLYWTNMPNDQPPYLGETLFPDQKKMGLDLKWIKGATGAVQVLRPSAFDVTVIPRPRIGFQMMQAEMPFFKESKYIDEVLRQELNMVIESGNAAYIEAIMSRVFADEVELLQAARIQRERLRMAALTTGVIDIEANGQLLSYDYGMPDEHKVTSSAAWSTADYDIIGDINEWMDLIEDDSGVRPTRAIVSRRTWNIMLNNSTIKKAIYVLSGGQASVSDMRMNNYLMEELGLTVAVYGKRVKDEKGQIYNLVPDNTFVLFPEGQLGSTWFGTTPEESDLLSAAAANVAIVDTGVAVTTMHKLDPVQVETKVSMICLPSFETADQVLIADVAGA